MQKLRRNHSKGGSRRGGSFMGRIVVVTILLIALCIGLTYAFLKNPTSNNRRTADYVEKSVNVDDRYYLPSGSHGELVHHDFFSLSYIEKHEQAEWVAYELTASDLKKKRVPRQRNFNPDYSVDTGSAFHRDYSHSGYTRGHMAPAGDMGFSKEAMSDCFFMSNMSPQIRPFNNGIWRELEEQVRDWAFDHQHLYIVTGPLLDNIVKKIGNNNVSVPDSFYKIILDLHGDEYNAIAFVMPHEKTDKHLKDFVVSIDQIESMTGLNFFDELLDDKYEADLEKSTSTRNWKFDQKRFKQRVNSWNNQK